MTHGNDPRPAPTEPPMPPTAPSPEDPQEREPMRDPPIFPERDHVEIDEV